MANWRLEYLSHHEKYFNDKEKSFLLSKIANGYYLANLDDKAINVLNDPSFISEPYSEGLWIKGLAFYRKGDFQTASRQFLILSKITSSKWLSNAGPIGLSYPLLKMLMITLPFKLHWTH